MSFADRFAGRRAVVTGGASGIGLGVATRLVAEGASVCLWDRDQAALDRAVGELGSQSSAVQVDITSWDAVAAATKTTV
jgi:NAD(P)-dependent dehydrogenase (short-subunit alcohol dehydrogenase family)